ncbi:MAG: tRNA (N(6)-L-threonylcarbamoyladenosine(37)-C(2))-methylthiotransferase MtaB [Ruminococcus sp.]|jgi:threonylcarbamoyladenosine tRNA methylthiotransferase MtaB|nr:tRNA (N(6)-L-threonylcarbamoyladenosine(37)-C(2))-methylthiotransferase MtaB [Ruminococcus sp.]
MYPNVYFFSFGCKVNLYETENIRENFIKSGFSAAENEKNAGIFIINTCTVTDSGDGKFFKLLRRLRREYPAAIIAAVGCLPQAFPEKLIDADIVCGTKNRAALPEIVVNFLYNNSKIIQIEEYANGEIFEPMSNTGGENRTRAYLKIQDGCNCGCAYCIIPKSRGSFRSKTTTDIIAETAHFRDKGCKEIVLTGINLAFWGVEWGKRLSEAVLAVSKTAPNMRIRLGSLEPERLDPIETEKLFAIDNLCPHFHLSLQSGCKKTLAAMGRRYTPAEFEELFLRLRKLSPNCGMTTDIMAGFPGETESDFAESNDFVSKLPFSDIHVFAYSKREGTKAAAMAEQVPEPEKHRRAAVLRKTGEALQKKFLNAQIGTIQNVLFEKEKTDGIPNGYTENYTCVKLCEKTVQSMRNELLRVKITAAESDFCRAELLPKGK